MNRTIGTASLWLAALAGCQPSAAGTRDAGAASARDAAGGAATGDGPTIGISVDGRPGTRVRVAVPAYFYPGPEWQRLIDAAPTVGMIVFNPSSGPGPSTDDQYKSIIQRAQAAGIIVLGYVSTSYGQRPEPEIVGDINGYYDLYPVSGIYLAEGPMDADCTSLEGEYKRLVSAARARDPRAYMAVGTRFCPTYIYFFDLMVQFARNWAEYQSYVPPDWMPANSPERFCHFINAVPPGSASAALSLGVANGAGWIFATDLADPNPWVGLPSYFDEEVAAARSAVRN